MNSKTHQKDIMIKNKIKLNSQIKTLYNNMVKKICKISKMCNLSNL
jgi:hypothetical protein